MTEKTYEKILSYEKERNQIHLIESEQYIDVVMIKSIGVSIKPMRKNASGEILNSVANALSSSISNGYEKIKVLIKFDMNDGSQVILPITKEVVVRFGLEYYEDLRIARDIQARLKKKIGIK